jgi:hypothetical protein
MHPTDQRSILNQELPLCYGAAAHNSESNAQDAQLISGCVLSLLSAGRRLTLMDLSMLSVKMWLWMGSSEMWLTLLVWPRSSPILRPDVPWGHHSTAQHSELST